MAISFQYNKTFLQQLNSALKIRVSALPTLQARESALRLEVKKAKQEFIRIGAELRRKRDELASLQRLWNEFPAGQITVEDVRVNIKKIAGVKIPVLDTVLFHDGKYSLFSLPSWFLAGIQIFKSIVTMEIQLELAEKKTALLEYARKKTTQKVNLYQKVQIPDIQESIRKIKRFLEDEDNLAKSSQKMLKEKMALLEVSFAATP